MKKQIKDLDPHELDFLVAKAEGLNNIHLQHSTCYVEGNDFYSPTTSPSQAWPIIERERIAIISVNDFWKAYIGLGNNSEGKTSLESAMRCYVASKFGNEVDIDNLINK